MSRCRDMTRKRWADVTDNIFNGDIIKYGDVTIEVFRFYYNDEQTTLWIGKTLLKRDDQKYANLYAAIDAYEAGSIDTPMQEYLDKLGIFG